MDYTVVAPARISLVTFMYILERAQSPAAPEARPCYLALVNSHVDPAFALAQFKHESSFGKAGIARTNKSWGNIRRSDGEFIKYNHWYDGAFYYGKLVSGPLYAKGGFGTALTLPYRYAPKSDGNNPAAYGLDLVAYISYLVGLEGKDTPETVPMINLVPISGHKAIQLQPGVKLYKNPLGDVYATISKAIALTVVGSTSYWVLVADGDTGVWVNKNDDGVGIIIDLDRNVGV